MRVINKKERFFVRVIIGVGERGCSNVKKPIKVISVADSNVEEVFNKISKCLESEK